MSQVYVACLSSYNNGILHGAWIDADQDADGIRDDIQTMLAHSPMPDAEEWAIHDYDGLPSHLGEWPDLEEISTIAQGIEEHGDAFRAYLEVFDDSSVENFEQRYLGEYRTRQEFAEDWLDQTGGLAEMPEHLQYYFDFDAYGRDMLMNGDVVESDGFWFSNH